MKLWPSYIFCIISSFVESCSQILSKAWLRTGIHWSSRRSSFICTWWLWSPGIWTLRSVCIFWASIHCLPRDRFQKLPWIFNHRLLVEPTYIMWPVLTRETTTRTRPLPTTPPWSIVSSAVPAISASSWTKTGTTTVSWRKIGTTSHGHPLSSLLN